MLEKQDGNAAGLRKFWAGWWLLFIAINCYYSVFVAAQTTIHPISLNVFVGDNAVFECNTKESLRFQWQWYHGMTAITVGNSTLVGGYRTKINDGGRSSRMTVLNTTVKDNQTHYYCQYGSSSHTSILTVIVGTRLDPIYPQCEHDTTSLNIDKTVTMTCSASGGNPRPELQWYRNGGKLTEEEDFESKNGNYSYFDEFTRELTVDDETAIYICRAEGLAVKGDQNCSILLETPPTVTTIANTTYFNVGDSLKFTCMVLSPWRIVDYIWTVNNQLVTTSNAIFSENNSTLILSNLQSEDVGKEIGCNALTSSGLNGYDSVIISLFDVAQKNNTFQLIAIVVGGVIVSTLLCVTLFLLIRQRQKQNRTNKTAVLGKTSIAQGAPLDGQDFCTSEDNSAYHGYNTSFPLSENPSASLHHYDGHIDVNGDQENVSRGRPFTGFANSVNTASLGSSKRIADLERLE